MRQYPLPHGCINCGCFLTVQLDGRLVDQERARESPSGYSDDKVSEADSSPNKISEDTVKCLFGIFARLSTKDKAMESGHERNKESECKDPYGICSDSKTIDIGPDKHLCAIEANTVDLNRRTNALFLIHRLK